MGIYKSSRGKSECHRIDREVSAYQVIFKVVAKGHGGLAGFWVI